MIIEDIKYNNRRKVFEIKFDNKTYFSPYTKAEIIPQKEDPIEQIYIDEELGKEAFTYKLKSGLEGTIHIEQVLEFNKNPDHLKNIFLYRLTIEAQKRIEDCNLSKREISRILKTSTTQLYRLLNQTIYDKPIGQMLALLEILNCDVDIVIRDKKSKIA